MSSRGETPLINMKYAPDELQKLFIVAGILIILGAFNIYSSTYYMNMEAGASPYSHILRHLIFLTVSIVVAFGVSKVPYRIIKMVLYYGAQELSFFCSSSWWPAVQSMELPDGYSWGLCPCSLQKLRR